MGNESAWKMVGLLWLVQLVVWSGLNQIESIYEISWLWIATQPTLMAKVSFMDTFPLIAPNQVRTNIFAILDVIYLLKLDVEIFSQSVHINDLMETQQPWRIRGQHLTDYQQRIIQAILFFSWHYEKTIYKSVF